MKFFNTEKEESEESSAGDDAAARPKYECVRFFIGFLGLDYCEREFINVERYTGLLGFFYFF